jgi:D-tyrosyl-tRNA(Tyr) deacylase
MRAVIQRVKSASVTVDGAVVSSIGQGLMILVGIGADDTEDDTQYVAGSDETKNWDGAKPWDRNVMDIDGEVLFVSQFTLHGYFKGNKPDFHHAMGPTDARKLYSELLTYAREKVYVGNDETRIKDGIFGAKMDVALVNDGPVTLLLDSRERK